MSFPSRLPNPDTPDSPLPTAILNTTMPQLPEVQDAQDDWTGVTSAATRRRLQNRLNQRAQRPSPP